MDAGLGRAGPLDQQHREHGARMAACGGISMPSWYSGRGALFETHAARESVGVFDCSHLPRLFVSGNGAPEGLRQALTYDVRRIAVEDSHETLFCSEEGGVLDRLRVHRLGALRWLLVPNAVQNATSALCSYINAHAAADLRIDDRTGSTTMLALEGPAAVQILSDLLSPAIVERTPAWHSTEIELYGHKALLWRTGAPQRDGFHVVCSIDAARHLWHLLIAAGATPCGLSCREILRQESGQAAVGHEFDGDASPFEAGLESLLSLGSGDFRGKEALEARRSDVSRRLVCLAADARDGIFRQGLGVLRGSQQICRLTSGGFSPSLGRAIGMAYIPDALAYSGAELTVDVRGRRIAATVLPQPVSRSAGRD
jgi:aminomethyltransferase